MRLATSTAAFLACCALAAPVRAQDAGVEEARGAFEAGQAAYRAGRFPEALQYFERAYELTEEPDLLYNIATVHDRLRHDREALDAYRAYLEARPRADDRANLEARIRVLEEAVASAEAAPPIELEPDVEPDVEPNVEPDVAPRVAPEPEPPPPPADAGPGPWVLVGVGAAVAVAGGVLVGLMVSDLDTVQSANGVPFSAIRDAYDRVPIFSTSGFVAIGVGAALLGAGIGWAIAGSSDGSTQVTLTPTGAAVRGRF